MIKNILTIDVESFLHSRYGRDKLVDETAGLEEVSRSIDMFLGLLKRYNHKATFFVLGVIAERLPQAVKNIVNSGHEIASHGYQHRPIFTLKPEQFKDDLMRSKNALERITGTQIIGFRAPYWSITKKSLWAIDLIKECGFSYDSSISPAVNFLYGIEGAQRRIYKHDSGLWEIPPTTIKLFGKNIIVGGGFYLRALPYFVTRYVFKRLNKKKSSAMAYFHPHEVLNTKSDMDLPLAEDFILNFNKDSVAQKLIKLLGDFEFDSVKNVLNDEYGYQKPGYHK
ncbi:MAG: DUF3473 domain-containing protein [Candidatus Omnitrophota bacterium]|jgi:polysaccharide deacetylase family protein (PEP-CTERM system associated)|nr:MAG: DUF3473 domain-containing protein [Candidatus Omnitrophota bacterium]